ncbi:DUF397 domain-containing protein [Actinomadura soli]|uniref:DUF397 domain-containing protein n=1 Tax=Actinomadura soli TaxID=2508997 RepID=A0A5C4J7W6_9ACTN|nr:DUF397 domain-containing protein [Actinomadura soli]TMQ92130.1 DUF397 domain-containing protein [Actinomadura soli]
MTRQSWRKSSHSGTQQGDCVEVADLIPGIGIRDSKDPDLGHLTLTSESFAGLIRSLKQTPK